MHLPLLTLLFVLVSASPHVPLVDQTASDRTFDTRVPVQLGVMSKCPDALLCESTFNEVLGKVGDKMDLSLVYVAKYIVLLIELQHSSFDTYLDLMNPSLTLGASSANMEQRNVQEMYSNYALLNMHPRTNGGTLFSVRILKGQPR